MASSSKQPMVTKVWVTATCGPTTSKLDNTSPSTPEPLAAGTTTLYFARLAGPVRYPATADQMHGLALAWTPRAVYIEWDGSGTHRTWVWASAVESATASQSATSNLPPQRQQVNVVTIRDTESLVALINAQLAQSGAEFVTSMAQPAGPFGAVVFGSINDHAVRLEFFIDPATSMCAVHLFDMTTKKVLAERVAAPTFEKAIEGYPWGAAIDMLGNT